MPHKTVQRRCKYPTATGFEADLYAFDGLPPQVRTWFEDEFLKHVDNEASVVIASMLRGNNILDGRGRSAFARFVMALRLRHPDVMAELRVVVRQLVARQFAKLEREYPTNRTDGDPATFELFIESLKPGDRESVHVMTLKKAMDSEAIGNRILAMSWSVRQIENADSELALSDWSLMLSLGSPKPFILLPLGPRHVFSAFSNASDAQTFQYISDREVIERCNSYSIRKARRFVWTHGDNDSQTIVDGMSSDVDPTPLLPSLYEKCE